MSEGCQEAVQALAKCHGRERVDHIVAIHVNAFTGSAHIFSSHLKIFKCFPMFLFPKPSVIIRSIGRIMLGYSTTAVQSQCQCSRRRRTSSSQHKFPMANVDSMRKATLPHKKASYERIHEAPMLFLHHTLFSISSHNMISCAHTAKTYSVLY